MINTDTVRVNDYGREIKLAPDGGYYVLGETDSLGEKDLVLLKVDNNLDKVSTAQLNPLGAGKSEMARALCVQEDGGLAILGEYKDDGGTLKSFLYIYYPDDNSLSWIYDYGNYGKDFNAGNALLERDVQGYSFPATGNNFGISEDLKEAQLILTDETGLPEIPVPYGEKNIGVDLLKTGSEYVMLSNNYETGNVPDGISVFRIDDTELIAEERIGPEVLEGRSIAPTKNGYVITGAINKASQIDKSDIILIKTDRNIKPLWENDLQPAYKSFGGSGEDFGVKVVAVENGFVILGISQVAGLRMITLIRTDLKGNLVTN
jgi:hypothetical protein